MNALSEDDKWQIVVANYRAAISGFIDLEPVDSSRLPQGDPVSMSHKSVEPIRRESSEPGLG